MELARDAHDLVLVRFVDCCHLGGHHAFDLVLRRGTLNDREHEVWPLAVKIFGQGARVQKLRDKNISERVIRRSQRVHQHVPRGRIVGMIEADGNSVAISTDS